MSETDWSLSITKGYSFLINDPSKTFNQTLLKRSYMLGGYLCWSYKKREK